MTIEELVAAIHATPQRMVMAFAGAGVQALSWLHAVGGSSRTVLEAVDIYADRSMIAFLGFTPNRFTSRRVAAALAGRAYGRARAYVDPVEPDAPVFGLGSTATIATDYAKRGQHRVAIAVRDGFGTLTYALTMSKGVRNRAEEEEIVSLLILRAVADACGVLHLPELPLVEGEALETGFAPAPLLADLGEGRRPYVLARRDGTLGVELPAPGTPLLSGAFHPLHDGHRELAAAAARHLGRPTFFELPLANADKAAIALVEARRRAQQFPGLGALALTREALFLGKAALFRGCVFVIGADTAARILDPRFYPDGGRAAAGTRTALPPCGGSLSACAATAAASWSRAARRTQGSSRCTTSSFPAESRTCSRSCRRRSSGGTSRAPRFASAGGGTGSAAWAPTPSGRMGRRRRNVRCARTTAAPRG